MMMNKKFWVGVGASAGGLDALNEFVKDLRRENAVYIIAQHLDPKHPTILKSLLERSTSLPINLIEEDTRPKEGEIYIISPGHNAIIEDETIILKPAAAIGPKPSVTEFFTSLATQMEELSIGVILSGTGSDGAQGLIAIKAAGGIAFSQDEVSAKYSGMPRSAMQTGIIDFVLPPKEIAVEIKQYIESFLNNTSKFFGPKVRSNTEKIFQRLYDQTNYDFSGYKIKTLQRRIQRRMVVNKVITLDDYATLLMSSSNEVEQLYKELLISVTSFFRDSAAFEELFSVVEDIVIKQNTKENIRIWVAGCARGEEAYSIAILFEEAILKHKKNVRYQVFATDIDDQALNIARQGTYTGVQVKDIKENLLKKYFNQVEEVYILKKELRDQIVFAKQNVIMDPPFSHLDLISCRNVMIYFNLETQNKVFQTFHFALRPNGYLFLGKSESASNYSPELFKAAKRKSQIFAKRLVDYKQLTKHIPATKIVAQKPVTVFNSPTIKIELKETVSLKEQMEKTLLNKIIPTSVVINSTGLMLQVRGDLNRYIRIPEGRIDNNILTMAKEDLKIDIRSIMQRAKLEKNAGSQALFYSPENENQFLYLTIAQMDGYDDDLFVLSFFNLDIYENSQPSITQNSQHEVSSDRLKKEVEIFRERLQSSIQDLETTNEEFQSTNEELQSANEELQSANEELQTANEELQSTNEELSTVNEELEIKTHELSLVNNDLESMLGNIDEIILFIDTRLRLKRYTNKAGNTFKLNRDDLGQVITSFDLVIDIPNLRVELLNVIEKETEISIKLKTNNHLNVLRLVAYKAEEREVIGVILFFEKEKRLKKKGIATSDYIFKLLEEQTKQSLLSVNNNNEIAYISDTLLDILQYHADELINQSVNKIIAQENNVFDITHHTSADQEGWRSIALAKKDNERFVSKYKVEKLPDNCNIENIIFFK